MFIFIFYFYHLETIIAMFEFMFSIALLDLMFEELRNLYCLVAVVAFC